MSKQPDQGQSEAHTPPAGAADQALPGADPLDLLAGSPHLEPEDIFAMAAEPALLQRRARGRPEGALNRKNNDMIKYLAAKGHRDPWETLSLIQSADTLRLAMYLRVPMQENGVVKRNEKGETLYNPPNPEFVAALQERAATTLMKFHHSAKPQQLDLDMGNSGKRPLMMFGDGANVMIQQNVAFDSAGIMPNGNVEENQRLIEGETVREKPDNSHG